MNIYIDERISISISNNEACTDLVTVLETLADAVSFSTSETTLTIYEQKLALTEIDANTFVSELVNCVKVNMEFASIGGSGCDFSIRITV